MEPWLLRLTLPFAPCFPFSARARKPPPSGRTWALQISPKRSSSGEDAIHGDECTKQARREWPDNCAGPSFPRDHSRASPKTHERGPRGARTRRSTPARNTPTRADPPSLTRAPRAKGVPEAHPSGGFPSSKRLAVAPLPKRGRAATRRSPPAQGSPCLRGPNGPRPVL